MKAIHVGILTPSRQEYEEFRRDNRVLICTHIEHVYDLERETFDFFLRLYRWERLDSELLRAVSTIEKMRDIDHAPKQFPTFKKYAAGGYLSPPPVLRIDGRSVGSVFFDEFMNPSAGPNCRCNVQERVTSDFVDAIKYAQMAMVKLGDQMLQILPDDLTETT